MKLRNHISPTESPSRLREPNLSTPSWPVIGSRCSAMQDNRCNVKMIIFAPLRNKYVRVLWLAVVIGASTLFYKSVTTAVGMVQSDSFGATSVQQKAFAIHQANLNRSFMAPTIVDPIITAATSSSSFMIPNIFHFIRFNQPNVTFVEMLAMQSALRLNPTLVLIHSNDMPQGIFWDTISGDKRLVVVHLEPPENIYGIEASYIQHKSDLARIHVLQQYGGIYLDNDCIMLRSVDHLRKHSCVVAKSQTEKYLGNMFIMAAVGCKFLDKYEELYRTLYDPTKWYYNAGELPTTAILDKYPGIAWIVDEAIQQKFVLDLYIFSESHTVLAEKYDMVHTLYNHKGYMVKDNVDYDFENVYQINNTFCNIARWLLSGVQKPIGRSPP